LFIAIFKVYGSFLNRKKVDGSLQELSLQEITLLH